MTRKTPDRQLETFPKIKEVVEDHAIDGQRM
jgi:hypothetical protein